MNPYSSSLFFLCILGLVGCATPTPKYQAFPQLDKAVQARVKAGDKVVYPELVHSVKPTYPDLPANGSVWAVMRVSETGNVREVKTIGESPQLYQSAIQTALLQWRFRPGTIQGKTSEFPMQVKITFASGESPERIEAAKAKSGLIYNPNEWMVKKIFPELQANLNRQLQQGKKIVPPKAVKQPVLSHHPDSNKIGWVRTGTIRTVFIVNEQGRPEYIHILGEDVPKDFQDVVVKAIREAVFTPATVAGKAHPYPVAGNFHFGGP